MKLLTVAALVGALAGSMFAPARSSWGRSCLIQSDVHVIKIGHGCKATRVIVPNRMHVIRR